MTLTGNIRYAAPREAGSPARGIVPAGITKSSIALRPNQKAGDGIRTHDIHVGNVTALVSKLLMDKELRRGAKYLALLLPESALGLQRIQRWTRSTTPGSITITIRPVLISETF